MATNAGDIQEGRRDGEEGGLGLLPLSRELQTVMEDSGPDFVDRCPFTAESSVQEYLLHSWGNSERQEVMTGSSAGSQGDAGMSCSGCVITQLRH